jgi:hypothetical protein
MPPCVCITRLFSCRSRFALCVGQVPVYCRKRLQAGAIVRQFTRLLLQQLQLAVVRQA